MIKIASPRLGSEEEAAVIDVLRSGLLAQGEKVALFEKKFADFINSKHAIATSSGTTALHLALLGLGIGPGDEVITTAFSFIASTNAILYTGAKPVFVDIDPQTFNLNPEIITEKITEKTKAILVVHLYGLPADMKRISQIAKKYNLLVIEDACQAHGAMINNQMVGTFADVGCFSFYPTKNMTTGEGGMVVTNNDNVAEKVKLLREHGMKKRYYYEMLGYNFRMTEIAAVIGMVQLKKLDKFNAMRNSNATSLTKLLSLTPQVTTPYIPAGFSHVFHQYTIKLANKQLRNSLQEYLYQNGVGSAIYYPLPIHKQRFLLSQLGKVRLNNTEDVADRVLSLPIHPGVTKLDIALIAKLINQFFNTRI